MANQSAETQSMTPAEHYAEAERLLEVAYGAWSRAANERRDDIDASETIAAAQVHATLALSPAGLAVDLEEARRE